MADKYVIQRRTASGLENVAELPALENGKVDLSWLPVVGSMGSAIIERGSNANGEYVRWADGTQVCRGTTPELSLTYNPYAGVFQATHNITFPAQFINNNVSCVTSVRINGQAPWGEVSSVDRSTARLRVFDIADRTGVTTVVFSWLAIGRWK